MHFLSAIVTIILLLLTSTVRADDAKTVALITWRGMTSAEYGFMSKLSELGVEVKYEHFDASRDETKLAGFLRKNRNTLAQKDLIYTFGSTTTTTVQNFDIGGVPQIFNIVTDPIGSGVTQSIAKPSLGATGAKLSLSPKGILELLDTMYPFKSVAILFDPRENNSSLEAEAAARAATELGKSSKLLRLIPDSDFREAQVTALKPHIQDVDVVFVASTSSFVTFPKLLRQLIPETQVSVSSSPEIVDRGITIAFGDEYWDRGEAAAEIARQLLAEGKLPSQVSIDEITPDEATVFIRHASPAKDKLNIKSLQNKVKYR